MTKAQKAPKGAAKAATKRTAKAGKATPAVKSTPAAKAKAAAKSTPAAKSIPAAKSTPAAKSKPAKPALVAKPAPAGPDASAPAPAEGRDATTKSPVKLSAFHAVQKARLLDERGTYLHSAHELRAQADSLALEHEPGDVQFDEEGGEGGTSNVDRELDLVLSAQAMAAVNDIDWALDKLASGSYGLCEQCGQPIPEARLEALPHAALCVSCKSGGLSSRR